MKLSRYEQEVIINFNAADREATVYSANPAWIKKMYRLHMEYPDIVTLFREDEVSKTFIIPKKLIKIGKPTVLSEAQLIHLQELQNKSR